MSEKETVETEGYIFELFKEDNTPRHLVLLKVTSKDQTISKQKICDDVRTIIQDLGKWEDISAGIELIKKL